MYIFIYFSEESDNTTISDEVEHPENDLKEDDIDAPDLDHQHTCLRDTPIVRQPETDLNNITEESLEDETSSLINNANSTDNADIEIHTVYKGDVDTDLDVTDCNIGEECHIISNPADGLSGEIKVYHITDNPQECYTHLQRIKIDFPEFS